jgi:hypothetical protein
MAKVKSSDPYGSGFFDDSPPPAPTESEAAITPEPAAAGRPDQPAVAAPSPRTRSTQPRLRSGAEKGPAGGGGVSTNGPGPARTEEAVPKPDGSPPVPTVRLNADIDRELHRRLRLRVAADDTTIADFLRNLLERELR